MKANMIFSGKGKDINFDFFKRLYDRGEKENNKLSEGFNLTQNFYAGNQWDSLKGLNNFKENGLVYNSLGETIWFFGNKDEQARMGKYAKRVVNYIKPYIDTQVAAHAEVDPRPMAIPRGTGTDPKDKGLEAINVGLNQIFEINNNFNQHYQTAARQAYLHSYHITQIYVDYVNMDKQGDCPIKFAHVNMPDFWIDPEATDINNAEYIIQKVKIPKLILAEKYDYTYYNDTDDEIDEFELEEIFVYWLKIETVKQDSEILKNNNLPKTVWCQIATLKNKWLKRKDKDGEVTEGIENYIVNTLPFVLWRTNIMEKYHGGSSKGLESIDLQVQANKLESAVDYNTRVWIDPPVQGSASIDVWEGGNKPSGVIHLKAKEIPFEKVEVNLLDPSKANIARENIKAGFDLIFGNVEIMEGRNPKGTYSNVHFQSQLDLAKLKPKLIEKSFMTTIKDLAEKTLRVWAESMGAMGVTLFNPNDAENNVTLTPALIKDQLYRVDVKVTDANLMSAEAKVNKVIEIAQYIPNGLTPYDIMVMIQNAAPGFYTDDILDQIKKSSELQQEGLILQAEAQVKQTKQQMQPPVNPQEQGRQKGQVSELEQIIEQGRTKAQELGLDPYEIDSIIDEVGTEDHTVLINAIKTFLSKADGIVS